MSRHYNPKTFLREASNKLIKEYLCQRSISPEHWNEHRETDVQPILDAIAAAPPLVQNQLDADFQKISALATEQGVTSLRRIADERGFDFDADEKMPLLDQCFYAFLYCEDLFYEAEIIDEADSARSNTRPMPKLDVDASDEAKEALRQALIGYFSTNQARGRGCDIDYRAQGGKHYFTCKLSDYAETHTTFDENQTLQVDTHRPTFDARFVYDPEVPELETTVGGGKVVREAVEDLFGQSILGINMLGSPARLSHFKLQPLLTPTSLPVDGNDGISSMTLRGLTLSILGSKNETIFIRTAPTEAPEAIYSLLKRALNADLLTKMNQISVSRAEFRAVFDPDGFGRAKSLTFAVSNPDYYTGIGSDARADALRKYLKRWGIDVTGTAECSADGDGHAVQHILRPG